MPLNDKKILSIILEQCGEVEDRCPGYREEIVNVISEIIEYERQHRVQGTNIQKKIKDKWRCIMPENVIEGHFGITYMKSPENKNHLGKCADFTRKEDDK